VDEARGRGVGKIGGPDQIDAADLDGIEAERAGAQIQHALHHEGGRGPRDAAVGPGRGGIGRHRGDLAAVVSQLVGPGQEPAGHQRLDARGPRIHRVGARVAGHAHVHGEQHAGAIEAGPHRVVVVARVRGGQ
jgi:hypothetical protein